ncbi:MAG: DoxX family membrane protein [Clostridiaceae bacterium]|nr:DoxX family membrane protein [Clostridiaceae bacterium]
MHLILRYILAVIFGVAGIAHFTRTEGFSKIVPHYLPFKDFIVKASGIVEILFSVLLLFRKPGYLFKNTISSFLLLVLPANIYMARNALPLGSIDVPKPLLWARVPLQFVLIKIVNKL